jgi:2-polyprenyl-3-methyl-5-hydroxy-6-metoxy-1,4-benzoquinol methylase
MNSKSNSTILNYQYPKLLFQFPQLIQLVFVLNYCFQYRKWTLIRTWKKALKKQTNAFVVADIGAGESQFLIPFCKQYPKAEFWAYDKHLESVHFIKQYPLKNLYSTELDIEVESAKNKADLLLCIGVLQYIQNDEQALHHIYESLKKKGTAFLYVPINGKQYTRFYQWVFLNYPNYETLHYRRRIYTEQEIEDKLLKTGFKISNKTYTYGPLAAVSHEISTSLMVLFLQGNGIVKLLSLPLLVLFFPIQMLLYFIDFNTSKNTGNGLLLELIKD